MKVETRQWLSSHRGTVCALVLALPAAACAVTPQSACPAGQEELRTAQLFLGRSHGEAARIDEGALKAFIDTEITPRFPDGLTVLDGGGQWRGSENQLIREAAKVVLIVLPQRGEGQGRIEAVRAAYRAKFRQETALLITQAACVSF